MSQYPQPYGAPYGAPGGMQSFSQPQGTGQPASMNLTKAFARIGEQALWSTHAFAANGTNTWAGNHDVFASAIGSSGQGFQRLMTKTETNLFQPGSIPAGLSFKVYGVSAQPFGYVKGDPAGSPTGTKAYSFSQADYNAVQGYGTLAWVFLNSEIDIAPLNCIGAAGGTFGGTADTGAAYGGTGTAGMGSMVSLNHGGGAYWVYSSFPVQLEATVTLRVRIQFPTSAPVIDGGPEDEGNPSYDPGIRVGLFGVYEQAIAVG